MGISTYDEALTTVLRLAQPQRTQWMPCWDTPSRRVQTAAPVRSPGDIPPFPRSMMDGFAVHAENLHSGARVRVRGEAYAGLASQADVAPGFAVQVRTGAPIPRGSSAVVRKEWIEWEGERTIQILRNVALGESIQPAGEDATAGSIIVSQGTPLNGQTRAVLRTAGIKNVAVYDACRIGIIATGSELVATPTPLGAGQIYAASDAFLVDTLRDLGAVVTDILFVEDDLDQIKAAVEKLIDQVDYLLITGGASVGDTDFVKTALKQVGNQAELPLERVWMRPGSPFVATRIGNTTIYGMSGNPAACFVQFHALSVQAIRWTLGYSSSPFELTGILGESIAVKPVKHVRFYRAMARVQEGTLTVSPEGSQSSGVITGLPSVNAIIRLDDNTYRAGQPVPLQLTAQLF